MYELSELRKAETDGRQLSAAELRGRREGNKTRGDDGKRKEETDGKEEEKEACLFSDVFFTRVANASHLENPKMHYGHALSIVAKQGEKKLCWFY